MTQTIQLSRREQNRSKTIAAASLVLAPVVIVGLFVAGGDAGYENLVFVWTHLGAILALGLLAIGGTAVLYADGARRLGLAGLVGTGFAWIATGAAVLWAPIAWQATVFAQTGSSSMDVFASLFSPLGSAYFVAITFVGGLAVAGLGLGFFGTNLVHRVAAGFAVLVGVATALWMFYALATAMPSPLAGSALTVLLMVVKWGSVLVLGVSLFVKNRSASAADVVDDGAVSADD